ncbi:hypothetical protein [Brevibacillus composti]|uniref:Alliinase C-terminal domain-containing protein n=1 Tax=Brevibacillus composti TaxID=2796470 RepID=A0A7T5JPF2_9BACL|nr:hypothetical protein JD108_04490 [Brevibacillus composti]
MFDFYECSERFQSNRIRDHYIFNGGDSCFCCNLLRHPIIAECRYRFLFDVANYFQHHGPIFVRNEAALEKNVELFSIQELSKWDFGKQRFGSQKMIPIVVGIESAEYIHLRRAGDMNKDRWLIVVVMDQVIHQAREVSDDQRIWCWSFEQVNRLRSVLLAANRIENFCISKTNQILQSFFQHGLASPII